MNRLELKAGCMAWLETLWDQEDSVDKTEFLSIDEDGLIEYNMTLCRNMRNENKLWMYKDIIGSPDDFSMSVLYDFWREKNGL